MTMQPDLFTDLAPSRASDPRSSVEAGRSCSSNKQMVAILSALVTGGDYDGLTGRTGSVTADSFTGDSTFGIRGVERNAWSSRLAAMERKGLLERCGMVPGRYKRSVIAFKLTELGRVEAERLRAHR